VLGSMLSGHSSPRRFRCMRTPQFILAVTAP
jgi:hypothetical protein